MALAVVLAGAAQGDSVVNQAVVPDLGGLSDDNAHAVIHHQAAADFGAWVDFNSGPEPAPLGDAAGQEFPIPAVKPVGHTMVENRMHTGIEQKYFQLAAGRGVPALVGLQQPALTTGLEVRIAHIHRISTPCVGRGYEKTPPVPKYERRRVAVPLSFITQGARDAGRTEGFHIPRAPGRTSQLPPQARFQPLARPLCPLGGLLLFPFIALFQLC